MDVKTISSEPQSDPRRVVVYAQSMSHALLPLLGAGNLTLTNISAHRYACNFQTRSGEIMAMVTPRHGNGPFHIVLPQPLPHLFNANKGVTGQWQGGALLFGNLHIHLAQAVKWHPHLPALLAAPDNAISTLCEITEHFPASPLTTGPFPLTQRAQEGIACLQIGITQQDIDKVQAGVTLLAGLGPGLTPAGDDFLVGLLAALHAYRLNAPMDKEQMGVLCQTIAETAISRTTRLSAAWLHYAGQGCFGEAWHHLIAALNRRSTDAIVAAAHTILTTGATSGVDAMAGFLFGMGRVVNR